MTALYHKLPGFLKAVAVSLAAQSKKKKKYGRYFDEYFSFLCSTTADERAEQANRELQVFLNQLRESSTFYDIPSDGDVRKMPILEKLDVVKNAQRILNGNPFMVVKSSGTTGQPLAMPYNERAFQKEYAFWWYLRSYEQIKRGDRIATFAGHQVVHVDDKRPPFWVMNYFENQLIFSSYHFSASNLKHYVKALNSFKPRFIHGYPSSIYLIAHYLLENNIQLDFRPSMVMTASETTLAFQKKAIEQAFQCKNYIWYGNTEYCGHITECPQGRLHAQPYHSHIRVVDHDGRDVAPGQEGTLVATNFTNSVFPLVNYNTKDVVRLSLDQTCACEKGGMLFDTIVGRVEDYIILPDLTRVGRLDHLFKNAKHVRNAQVEQNDIRHVIVRVEKEAGYTQAVEKAILHEARNRLGKEIDIVFEYVSEIPKEQNGKFKFIVQNIDTSQFSTAAQHSVV